ncbi:hypothetical protein Bca4012_019103 [Brassica carinata]|uniref:Ubiquitin-like domain-containing protein n=1 Tax=Brassica carinata TaxID=52824 RepID=A0A8X8BEC8_BRACI|nr:hypothetical protein Bca52824_002493 [Brassica carinata]
MKVFVDTLFGSTFSFYLDPRNKVFDIKKSIENSQGIPVSMQTLYFNDAELVVDHYQLRVYCIVNNSRLLLFLRADPVNNQMLYQSPYAIQGFVPSMGRSNYDQVPPSHASESFSNQYRLVSNDGLFPEMPQDISLKQGFWPGTTFGDNFKIQESLRINKKSQDLPSLPSNTSGDLSLGDDFTNIRSHWPASTNENHMFPPDQSSTFGDFLFGDYRHILTDNVQRNWPASTSDEIINKNQVFQTEHSPVQSNLTQESSNQVFQTVKSPPPQRLTLIMTQYDKPGRKFLLEVNATDNVEELKKELEYLLDLPAKGYFLLHKDRVLDDDKSFSINRVANGDTVEIFPGPVIEDYHT